MAALPRKMNFDAYFMEYDDDRPGDFRPPRCWPKRKTVVLGLAAMQEVRDR